MDKTTDFGSVGKRTCYRLPQGYMNELQQKLLEQARIEHARSKRRLRRLRLSISAAVAALVLVTATVFAFTTVNTTTSESERLMQSACMVYAQLSDDEQDMINNSLEDDIFLTLIDN